MVSPRFKKNENSEGDAHRGGDWTIQKPDLDKNGGGNMQTIEIDPKAFKKSKKYKAVKGNLIEQLECRGADTPAFLDLVEDYMALWLTKEMLRIDIENTGIRVAYDNGGGQKGYKDNPSIERQIKVNGQMLKLLSELGITTSNVMSAVEDEL